MFRQCESLTHLKIGHFRISGGCQTHCFCDDCTSLVMVDPPTIGEGFKLGISLFGSTPSMIKKAQTDIEAEEDAMNDASGSWN